LQAYILSLLFTFAVSFFQQVLIASHNRIREVYKDSFKRYTYLKYLYMDHNMISYVEKGTFDVLQNLEVIHLSHNALETVPAGVLRLPKLRKLFVNNNRLTDGGCFARVPPSETLESLSLANCNLVDLPPLDKYPNLLELNVSGNKLKSISPQQLAPMCRLYLLDLRANPMLFKDSEACECHLLAAWMKQMSIYFAEMPLDCSGETGRRIRAVIRLGMKILHGIIHGEADRAGNFHQLHSNMINIDKGKR
jgi:Leucine-rich repeat (LRR) protein